MCRDKSTALQKRVSGKISWRLQGSLTTETLTIGSPTALFFSNKSGHITWSPNVRRTNLWSQCCWRRATKQNQNLKTKSSETALAYRTSPICCGPGKDEELVLHCQLLPKMLTPVPRLSYTVIMTLWTSGRETIDEQINARTVKLRDSVHWIWISTWNYLSAWQRIHFMLGQVRARLLHWPLSAPWYFCTSA